MQRELSRLEGREVEMEVLGIGLEIFGYLKVTNDGAKTTILGPTGDYIRIGDAGVTANSLNSEDDLMVTGKLEVKSNLFFESFLSGGASGIITVMDDKEILLGSGFDVRLVYEATDANAKICLITIDESDDSGNNVPVLAFGEETNVHGADLGLFDAIVEPIIAAIDLAGNSYAYIGHSGANVPRVGTAGTGANGIILTNPKNAVASALSGTQLDVEIDIGGTPYHFTVYPTKA